jgi:azurin
MCKNLVKFTKTTLHAIEFNIRHDFNSHNRRKSIQAKLKKTCKQFFLLKPSSKKSCQTHGENLVITKIQGINSKPWKMCKGLLKSLIFFHKFILLLN